MVEKRTGSFHFLSQIVFQLMHYMINKNYLHTYLIYYPNKEQSFKFYSVTFI